MNHILNNIADTYHLVRKPGKWAGPCPQCGGSKTSDKFQIRDDGGFKCYGCDFKGDIITWLMRMEGKSCPEAHDEASLACRSGASCPAWGSCRHGDGSGRTGARRPAKPSVQPISQPKPAKLASASPSNPVTVWEAWASCLVESAAVELQRQPKILAWLAKRGIDAEAVRRFRLGWIAKNSRADRAAIGLPPGKKGEPTLWLPVGLLIPICNQDGAIHRLRVRRPAWARESYAPDLKYVWLDGSGKAPMAIRPLAGEPCRGAAIVEAELDAMAIASAHPQVMAIAIGTVKGGVPDELRKELAVLPRLLIALDADGPGGAAVAAWCQEYRQAVYWPVPAGKDPGEYAAEPDADLRLWVESGLVPQVCGASAMQSPVQSPMGGRGDEVGNGSSDDEPLLVEMADGRLVYVVKSREQWASLVAQGKLVLSENELLRLGTAAVACGIDGKRLVAAVLDVKELFSGSYVRASRGLEVPA